MFRIENKISHEDDERPGELRSALCFYGNFVFSPGWSTSWGKKTKELKSRLLHELAANRRPIVRTDSRGGRPNRSVSQSVCPTMSLWHRDSRKLCLRSPRLFMKAMQFTDNGLYTLVEKKYTYARISLRDETALIEFLDPRHSAWLFITRYISASRSAFTVAVPQIEKGNKERMKVLCAFCSMNFVNLLVDTRLFLHRLEIFPIRSESYRSGIILKRRFSAAERRM